MNYDGDSDSRGAITGNILDCWIGDNKSPLKYNNKLELKGLMKSLYEQLVDINS